MAQTETGLGWSAKSEWLTSAPAIIGTITTGGVTDPVPVRVPGQITADNAVAELYPLGFYYRLYPSNDPAYPLLTSNDAGAFPPVGAFVYISPPYAYVVYVAETDPSPLGGNVGCAAFTGNPATTIFSASTGNTWTLDTDTGHYYVQFQLTTGASYDPGSLPVFNNIRDGLDSFAGTDVPVYKLNAGPAVVCAAEWITPEGNTLISPVLISTVPEYTTMSLDMQTPATSSETFSFLKDGARFHMTIIGGNSDRVITSFEYADLKQFGAALPQKLFSLLADASFSNIIVGESPDPYGQETNASTEEGGDGEELEDDPVEEETLPVPSVAGHGFCTIYVPSSQELGQMASYLWSGAFDVTQVIKLMSNPMDSILGLSAVPVDLVGTSEQIYLGGVALKDITMPKYTGRTSVKVDFGTVTVAERWGSYLDYAPYTEFSIYLPFIGIKTIKADDIMGKTVSLMYAIDILSGGCIAYLRPAGGSVLYEWSGQCALQIPVTGRSYDNVFQSAMSVATATLAAVTAPASAPVLSGAVASAAVQAAASKPHIERSGTVNGITGFLGQLRPYLIRTIPEAYIPEDQNKFIGYPAYINVNLANVVGYNEVDSIHLEHVTATGAELEEIESILKGGVIF